MGGASGPGVQSDGNRLRLAAILPAVACAAALVLVAVSLGQESVAITRQPYIQNPTATTIDIMWKTNNGGDSVVRYGQTTAYASEVLGEPGRASIGGGVGFIHYVQLTGLQPDSRYFYQVVTSGTALTPVDPDYYFDSAPSSQSPAPFSFVAMGDIGDGSPSEQRVADLVDFLNPDIYLGLGDIVYDYSEVNQDPKLFQPYANVFRNVAWYPICGNHDNAFCHVLIDNHALPANSLFMTNPDKTLRRTVFSFDYGNAHFVALDSNIDHSATSAQVLWAQADLAASTATWKIMYWHHNAWSAGSHKSFQGDAVGMNLATFAIQNDVDVALWGHSHTYERFGLFQGTQFFTSGNGGRTGSTECLDHATDPSGPGPECLVGEFENEAGVLLGGVNVTEDRIKFCQWNEFGANQDGFLLVKDGPVTTEPCPALPAQGTPTPTETPPAPTDTPTPTPTPTSTPGPTPGLDSDGDGFSDAVETSAGTDPLLACGVDAWPPDIDNDGFSDTGDIGRLTNDFGDAVPEAAPPRHDIAPDPPDGFVDTGDIGRLTNVFGKSCPTPTPTPTATSTPSPTPAGAGTALNFDGTNDYVTFGPASGLGTATFTIEAWFKREGAGVGTNTGSGGIADAIPLVTKGRSENDGSNIDMNYFLGIQASTGRLVADFEEGPGGPGPLGQNHPVIGNAIITSNVWHHAAATYDGTTWRLYLDGALDAQLALSGSPSPRSDSIQHAALASAINSTGTAAGFFNGVLDEARVWNFARTEAEIDATRDVEVPSAAGLIGRWGMNEGTGTLVADSSGSGINGTATNGPSWVSGFLPASP